MRIHELSMGQAARITSTPRHQADAVGCIIMRTEGGLERGDSAAIWLSDDEIANPDIISEPRDHAVVAMVLAKSPAAPAWTSFKPGFLITASFDDIVVEPLNCTFEGVV